MKKTYTTLVLAALIGWGSYSFLDTTQIEMTTYSVSKDGHFSFPRILKLKRNPNRVNWTVKFNSDCDYRITENGKIHEDQYDWNKLCGLFFSLFNTRKDSAMMGWRYNPNTDEIEMAPYYHIDGGRDMFKPMMTVKTEEVFSVTLNVDYQAKIYGWDMKKEGFETTHEMPFNHNGGLCGFINFYFGGNQKAPQEVSADMSVVVY